MQGIPVGTLPSGHQPQHVLPLHMQQQQRQPQFAVSVPPQATSGAEATPWTSQQQLLQRSQQLAARLQESIAGSAVPQPHSANVGASIGGATQFTVTGCLHATVGLTVRGTYAISGDNHGRRAYKKDEQVNGLNVLLYFWDDRDGPSFGGWWFGPKVGSDQVWAYHPDKSAQTPPLAGWKVPYDGPVDPTFRLVPVGAGGAVVCGQQAQQPPQPQWAQAQQLLRQKRQLQEQQQQQTTPPQYIPRGVAVPPPGSGGCVPPPVRTNAAEEANRLRMEELKRQQEQIAARREQETRIREAEMERKRVEQKAAIEIRRVLQKLSLVVPETYEALKTELAEVSERELANCHACQEIIRKEIENALRAAKLKVSTIQENKRRFEELKAQEETKRQEQIAISLANAKELAALLDEAEAAAEIYKSNAATLVDGADLGLAELEGIAAACQDLAKVAQEKNKACSDFITSKSAELKELARKEGEAEADVSNTRSVKDMMAKAVEIRVVVDSTFRKATTGQVHIARRAQAKAKLGTLEQVVRKYDKDGDGALSKTELYEYAKGEFQFSLTPLDTDAIYQALAVNAPGLPLTDILRIKSIVGIARGKAIDAQRREQRLAKEKEIADRKRELQALMEAANAAAEEVEVLTKALEDILQPIVAKAHEMKALEILRLLDTADTQASEVNAAKKRSHTLTEQVVSEGPELKRFAAQGLAQLLATTSTLDARVAKCTGALAKCRSDAVKKEASELEALRKQALQIARREQRSKQINIENLFDEFDTKRDGAIDKEEFLSFFQRCAETATKAEGETSCGAAKIAETDLARLFHHFSEHGQNSISKDNFGCFLRYYLKVVKETILTTEVTLRGCTTIRRLEIGEVCEVVDGPVREVEAKIDRLRVKMLKDEAVGWATPMGSQGAIILQDGDVCMRVVKETILTPTFEINASKEVVKKLKVGELVDIVEWMRKEDTSGLMRMRVRTRSDLKVGYATAVGSAGAIFLEVA